MVVLYGKSVFLKPELIVLIWQNLFYKYKQINIFYFPSLFYMIQPRTYASDEARKAFFGLPESDQIILNTIHNTEASTINDIMNLRVDDIMQDAKIKTPEIAKKTTMGVIIHSTHLEVDGWRVSKENLWAPTLSEWEIEINPKKASRRKPQVWLKVIEGQSYWFYNYEGAKKEIEYRKEYYPSEKDLTRMINSISGSILEKAKTLNIPLLGLVRYSFHNEFYKEASTYLSTSSSKDRGNIWHMILNENRENGIATDWDRADGLLVRSFLSPIRIIE